MNKLDRIRARVDAIIETQCDIAVRDDARSHLYGVSEICARLARERGLDEEICSVAGLLHDIYRYRTGVEAFHAQSGAEMARVLLKREGGFNEGETTAILTAIFNHSDKETLHDAHSEALKDADVEHHRLFGGDGSVPSPRQTGFSAEAFARNAEEFARMGVRGEPGDAAFAEILRYWPEPEAYDELKNAWCAAFVYHMCMISGFPMPIKHPKASARFAGVGAWHEWAVENGFSFRDEGGFAPDCLKSHCPSPPHLKKIARSGKANKKSATPAEIVVQSYPSRIIGRFSKRTKTEFSDGFAPRRGDIVIYDGVIPPDMKPSGGPWHDHIGVVVSANGHALAVAEGNVGNNNVSGIVERTRGQNIGAYIRIPEEFEFA